jgi:hypothetical protein
MNQAATPTDQQINARAYQIYLARGCQPGHEVDDWLQAEYELRQLPVRKLVKLARPPARHPSNHTKSLLHIVRTAMLIA